jgi:hypothetical protein
MSWREEDQRDTISRLRFSSRSSHAWNEKNFSFNGPDGDRLMADRRRAKFLSWSDSLKADRSLDRVSFFLFQLRREQELQQQKLWRDFQEQKKELELQHKMQIESKLQVSSPTAF